MKCKSSSSLHTKAINISRFLKPFRLLSETPTHGGVGNTKLLAILTNKQRQIMGLKTSAWKQQLWPHYISFRLWKRVSFRTINIFGNPAKMYLKAIYQTWNVLWPATYNYFSKKWNVYSYRSAPILANIQDIRNNWRLTCLHWDSTYHALFKKFFMNEMTVTARC